MDRAHAAEPDTPRASMKVLTVREPWLTAIVIGAKNVENRGLGLLPSFERLIGARIGLHGALGWSARGAQDPRVCAALGGGLLRRPEKVAGYNVHPRCEGFGLIVGTATVVDAHPQSEFCDPDVCFPWGESQYLRTDGSWQRGVLHIVFDRAVPLDCVIPARGRLGLWESTELDEAFPLGWENEDAEPR
jgi:hypothetical protein